MDDYRLSEKDIIQLKRQHRRAKTKWEADRLKAVYLLGEGWHPQTVAHILDRDERTILSYFQRYQDGGIDQLLQSNYDGKESKLSECQAQELSDHLRNNTYTSSLYIIHFVRATFSVTYEQTRIINIDDR